MVQTKKQIIAEIKETIVFYAQPRGMESRPKAELEKTLAEAKRLKLTKADKQIVLMKNKFFIGLVMDNIKWIGFNENTEELCVVNRLGVTRTYKFKDVI